jgi:hypothetical protein
MSNKIYKTDNLAVCPYLLMNDLKYIRAEISMGKYDKPVVSFLFEDPLGVGKDLELDFSKSDFKKYRDIFFFFRNEIEKLKRRVDQVNLVESRMRDDKYADEIVKKEGNNGE